MGAKDGKQTKESKTKRSVSWGDMEIMIFKNILGDHPNVTNGAPLTIGWKPDRKEVISVEYFEFVRQTRPRRRRKDLVMSGSQRDTYLLGLGYHFKELLDVAEESKKIRKSRQANMKGNKLVDKFRGLFERKTQNLPQLDKMMPKIVAGKSA